jgi:hypothetical protein
MSTLKISINMAGAISAGAYTAGVLDFFTEALDAWYAAKRARQEVPTHDISIEAFSGASAGGMCAAISAVLLQNDFQHISDTTQTNTTNRFYESWVNWIDITELLKTDDLKTGQPVLSLLDCNIIEKIAQKALVLGPALSQPRQYVSPNLTLFLSLTNLRGVPYSLNGVAPGSLEETAIFYGDRIRFEILGGGEARPPSPAANVIKVSDPAADWSLLKTAAMATGAFPVFLAPRVLSRNKANYTPPLWESRQSEGKNAPPPISPTFPADLAEPFDTLNVDGGVTNNDPYNYSHDFLASLHPASPSGQLEQEPSKVDRAVLSISPFPSIEPYAVKYDIRANSSVLRALPRLFSALISQSRFFGESLSRLMSGTTFSHFVVAPSDEELVKSFKAAAKPEHEMPSALQCATLGAFGGFFERDFRAHDYALGRRNCQKFLRDHFVLPVDNVVMKEALDKLAPDARQRILNEFKRPAPSNLQEKVVPSAHTEMEWLPIIPLCSPEVATPIKEVPRTRMSRRKLDQVMDLILQRFRAVMGVLSPTIPSFALRAFLWPGRWVIPWLARKPLRDKLIKELGDSYQP